MCYNAQNGGFIMKLIEGQKRYKNNFEHDGNCFLIKKKQLSIHKHVGKKAIVYKKGLIDSSNSIYNRANHCIITLEIAHNTRVYQSVYSKCRAASAKVIKIEDLLDNSLDKAYSFYGYGNDPFVYKVGKIVKPANGKFDTSPIECGRGIHFFIEREKAINYKR